MLTTQHAEYIQQVTDVEADLQAISVIAYRHNLFRLFLFGIISNDIKAVLGELQANTAVLLVGENGRAGKGLTQLYAGTCHDLVGITRQNALIIGKLAINQLGREGEAVSGGPHVVATDNYRNIPVFIRQQPPELQYTLARENYLGITVCINFRWQCAHGEAVTVGGHNAKLPILYLPEHTVQVITDILLRHRKACTVDQPSQLPLLQRELVCAQPVFNAGEFARR